jgi:UDPglucose 6-dehydrogenase
LSYIAREMDTRAALAETTDDFNRSMAERIAEKLRPVVQGGVTTAILGLAYKPFSHVVEESQGVYLANALSQAGARVVAYDPLAGESANAELKGKILILDSAKKCLEQAEVVLITTADPEFQTLTCADFNPEFSKITVIDFWRVLRGELQNRPNVEYVPVGCSTNDEENAARLRELWHGERF